LIGLFVVLQLLLHQAVGHGGGALFEGNLGGCAKKGAVPGKKAEAVAHRVSVHVQAGVAAGIGVQVHAVGPVSPLPGAQDLVHSGGGNCLLDGPSHNFLLSFPQKITVILIDFQYDSIRVHNDEAIVGIRDKFLKQAAAGIVIQHKVSLSSRRYIQQYTPLTSAGQGRFAGPDPARPVLFYTNSFDTEKYL
jgi:hypothetical protein